MTNEWSWNTCFSQRKTSFSCTAFKLCFVYDFDRLKNMDNYLWVENKTKRKIDGGKHYDLYIFVNQIALWKAKNLCVSFTSDWLMNKILPLRLSFNSKFEVNAQMKRSHKIFVAHKTKIQISMSSKPSNYTNHLQVKHECEERESERSNNLRLYTKLFQLFVVCVRIWIIILNVYRFTNVHL